MNKELKECPFCWVSVDADKSLVKFTEQIDNWIEEGKVTVHEDYWPFLVGFIHKLQRNSDKTKELISAIRSINKSKHHEIIIGGDDDPCYWQRKEWVDWILELADEAEQAIAK